MNKRSNLVKRAVKPFDFAKNHSAFYKVGPVQRPKNEKGLASLVIVSVLVVLLTLISLGFARLMNRATVESTNRTLGDTATYAAQSGINDVIDYMKRYAAANPDNPYVASPECTGSNSLIGTADNKGPFYNDANLSGDSNTQYTCILLNQTPPDLVYDGIPELKSQVIKMTTSGLAGSLDSIMLSWQPSNALLSGYPSPSPTLLDETSWTDALHSYMPLLRATIYPVPHSGSMAGLQANSRTFFLYPKSPDSGTIVPTQAYSGASGINDGQILPVTCGRHNTGGNFDGKADYRCNLIINGLTDSVSSPDTDPIDYIYLRLTPIYGQLDVKIQANDAWGRSLKFIGVQALVDVTAKTSNVSKRLQARVSIGKESSGGNGNIQPQADDFPEFGVRSANALCKQMTLHHDIYDYITFDSSSSSICNTAGTVIPIPAPQLTFKITGNNGTDSGRPVESGVNNPDKNVNDGSAQNPQQQGTVFVGTSPDTTGIATINWNTEDTTHCTASGNWGGDVLYPPYNTTKTSDRDHVYFQGNIQKSGISTVQTYALDCKGPGGTLPQQTVTAWPWPKVTSLDVSPSTIEAGQPYTVSWASTNAAVKCSLTGGWPDKTNTSTSGSEPITWSQAESQDPNYSKTFTVTCYDPIGRSSTGTVTVTAPSGPPPSCNIDGFPCPSPNGPGQGVPPACSVQAGFEGTDSTDSLVRYKTKCDYWDSANWSWTSRHIEFTGPDGSIWSGDSSCAWASFAGCVNDFSENGNTFTINAPGKYCIQVYVWAEKWKFRSDASAYGSTSGDGEANSGSVCKTIPPPPVVIVDSLVDDGGYHWTNMSKTSGWTCNDGVHPWTVCLSWRVYQDDGKVYVVGKGTGVIIQDSSDCSIKVTSDYGKADVSKPATKIDWGDPTEVEWYNETLGWYSNPGTVTVTPKCTSPVYGNSGSGNALTVSSYTTEPPNSGGGSGGGGGSTGGGGGGGGSTGGGGGGGGGCFIAGTEILTPSGEKPIEKLKLGDMIETWDTAGHKLVPAPIVFKYQMNNKPTLWVATSGGSVTTTLVHPFWTGSAWVAAKDLKPGMKVMQKDGSYQTVILTMNGANRKVYNLEVGNKNHDFFANNMLVHNILTL